MSTYPSIILGSSTPLSQRYSLALLDLDGVVYRGSNPVAYASEGIREAAQCGMQIAYTTNNPSRYPNVVAEQISSFGIEASGEDVITSAMVAAMMLTERLESGSKVLVVGKDHLRDELSKAGFEVVDSSADQPHAVIQSWYPELAWTTLAQASYAIHNGAQYFVTNKDLTIPREEGIAPGNGAMQLPVIQATGQEPIASAGKPEAAMYHQARRLFSRTQEMVEVGQCLPVGDRLDTDIEAANRGGYDSAVVLTGVAEAYQIITAEPVLRPTFICADLRGLNTAHPAVKQALGGDRVVFTCHNAQAWVDAQRLHVSVDGAEVRENITSLNALRAAASAMWHAVDTHIVDGESVRAGIAGIIDLPQFARELTEDYI